MPGQIEPPASNIYTKAIGASLPLADQVNCYSNDGFAAEYLPTGQIEAPAVGPGNERVTLVAKPHPDQDEDTRNLVKEALAEFQRNHPKGLELIGKMMRGTIPDQPGISGGNQWRTLFAGATYDPGDGEGSFTVTAPE